MMKDIEFNLLDEKWILVRAIANHHIYIIRIGHKTINNKLSCTISNW